MIPSELHSWLREKRKIKGNHLAPGKKNGPQILNPLSIRIKINSSSQSIVNSKNPVNGVGK
jgi:hypothetical protein